MAANPRIPLFSHHHVLHCVLFCPLPVGDAWGSLPPDPTDSSAADEALVAEVTHGPMAFLFSCLLEPAQPLEVAPC